MYPSMFSKMLDNILMSMLRDLDLGYTIVMNIDSSIPFYTAVRAAEELSTPPTSM